MKENERDKWRDTQGKADRCRSYPSPKPPALTAAPWMGSVKSVGVPDVKISV